MGQCYFDPFHVSKGVQQGGILRLKGWPVNAAKWFESVVSS